MKLLQNIQHFDHIAFYWFLQNKHRNLAIRLGRWVSFTADGPLYVLTGLGLVLSEVWPLAKLMAVGFLIERVLYFIFKTSFKRNRPQAIIPGFTSAIVPSDKFSFPSGHTSAAFFMACTLSSAYPSLTPLLYIWASSVGASRVVLGVHFPTDILAGAIMGHTVCWVLLNFFQF